MTNILKEEKLELISNNTGNWEIYRMIDNETSKAFIFRFPKTTLPTKIDSYICNYNAIKSLGLPTLDLVERFVFESKNGIRTEDLNYLKDKIYVTHNSLYSHSARKLATISQQYINVDSIKKSSEYEEFRYKNRLKEITNFEEFIDKTKRDLMVASKRNFLIEFDSYFFGTQKEAEISTIDYKIVDLDNIYNDTEKNSQELYDRNVSEFQKAIAGFIKYFVNQEDQSAYEKYL